MNPKKKPTLSVFMPNYNHGRYLRESLGALVRQSYQPMEILVLDDASTDDSVAIIEEFAQQYSHIHLHRNEINRGVGPATAHLVEMAKGDYIFGTAADDKILPGFFQRYMDLLEEYPEAGLCACPTIEIDAAGKTTGLVPLYSPLKAPGYIPPGRCLKILYRHGVWVTGSAVIYRRAALMEAGGFRPELGPFCDGVVQQTLMLRYGACFIPEPLASWRNLPSGYLNSTYKDIDSFLDYLRNALDFIRESGSQLFPPSYLRKFDRRYRFSAGRYYLNSAASVSSSDREVFFEKILASLRSLRSLDAFFFSRSRPNLSTLRKVVAQLWLAARLGISPFWAFRRIGQKMARRKDTKRLVRDRPGYLIEDRHEVV